MPGRPFAVELKALRAGAGSKAGWWACAPTKGQSRAGWPGRETRLPRQGDGPPFASVRGSQSRHAKPSTCRSTGLQPNGSEIRVLIAASSEGCRPTHPPPPNPAQPAQVHEHLCSTQG